MNENIIAGIGTVLTVTGSLVLAWRVKIILDYVYDSIVAHEASIIAIVERIEGQPQTIPVITGQLVHLSNAKNIKGTKLLRLGFVLIGLGIAIQLFAIYLKVS
jgi:hypothetical protein